MSDELKEYAITEEEIMKLGNTIESLKSQRNLFAALFFIQVFFILFLLGVI